MNSYSILVLKRCTSRSSHGVGPFLGRSSSFRSTTNAPVAALCNRGMSSTQVWRMSAHTDENPPHPHLEDLVAPECQLMAGYMEHLDTMMDHTEKLEASLKRLKQVYAKKREIPVTIKWMDAQDVDRLFLDADKHKEDMESTIAELRILSIEARKAFVVDAECDEHLKDKMEQLKQIIDEPPYDEDPRAIYDARTAFAIDAPDGVVDIQHKKEDAVAEDTVKEYAISQGVSKEWMKDAGKAYAVDAPDGNSDGNVVEELKQVNDIIDHTSTTTSKMRLASRNDGPYQ